MGSYINTIFCGGFGCAVHIHKWAGLSWKTELSHAPMRQPGFSNILVKVMTVLRVFANVVLDIPKQI